MKGLRVALVNPPSSPRARYGLLAPAGSSAAPLGLLWLAAVLRRTGAEVRLVDAAATGSRPEQVWRELVGWKPQITGITAATLTANAAGALAVHLSRFSTVVLGGPHVSAVPEATLGLYRDVHVGVVGEGERTMVELAQALAAGGPLDLPAIPGTVRRLPDGSLARSTHRQPIPDLDELPFPAFDLLPHFPAGYRPQTQSVRNLPSVTLITSRGCPGKCTFCSRSVFGNRVRFHSADYVYDLVKWLVSRFGVRDIQFEDDCFTVNRRRVFELCRLLRRGRVRITWSCLARADQVDQELLREMRSAGCWAVQIGIETGSQTILDRLNKGITLDQVMGAIQSARRAGLRVKGFFMVGCPGETEESLQATESLMLRSGLNDVGICYFTPFPGTDDHGRCRAEGELNDDWELMNGYEPVFIPTGLTRQALVGWYRRLYWHFYARPAVFADYLSRIASWSQSVAFIRAFAALLHLRRG